jgi:putative nucleotidyltransferase with HDIG domain
MPEQFITVGLDEILVGDPLPATVYIYIDFRFITFRAEGDVVDRTTFDRLEFKKVKSLFIQEKDRKKFEDWSVQRAKDIFVPSTPEQKHFAEVKEEVRRKTMDIFQSSHPDKIVAQTIESSKKLVDEVMKFPYAVNTLAQLQNYSRGTVDHSVNVSVLSVYLGMQMGYSHALILQHLGMGGLLHDIGKTQIPVAEGESAEAIEKKMHEHPGEGLVLIESQQKVPNEVKMIISQHHECFDGTGFPKKIKGNAIYDLARIVSIANVFDELVGSGRGGLVERQKAAIKELDEKQYRKFDPQKLQKALKILKLGV